MRRAFLLRLPVKVAASTPRCIWPAGTSSARHLRSLRAHGSAAGPGRCQARALHGRPAHGGLDRNRHGRPAPAPDDLRRPAARPHARRQSVFNARLLAQHGGRLGIDARRGARAVACATTACAAGAQAIGDACRIIERGDADVMIAGGSEAVVSPLVVACFGALRALSTRNDAPAEASRPSTRSETASS